MKKRGLSGRVLVLALAVLLAAAFAAGTAAPTGRLHPPDGVRRVDVRYFTMGTVVEKTLTPEEAAAWTNWLDGLTLRRRLFPPRSGREGGLAYEFTVNGGEASFTYSWDGVNGSLLLYGAWYQALTPTAPFPEPEDG